VAVAEEFLRRDRGTEVLFVGTGRPVEAEVLERRGLPSRGIVAAGLKGKSVFGRLRSLAALPVGLYQSVSLIRSFKPDMVFGVGGYVSGPVAVAAKLLGRPTAVHEQNSIPGLTNRWLGRIVDLIFISFESSRKYFPEGKTHLTGNPIREEIAAAAREAREPRREGFTLLVAGGSQGAHAINMAAVQAAPLLAEKVAGLRVIHQTGAADEAEVRRAYQEAGIEAEVKAFIQDMDRVYLAADLAVCRAGALTLAETAAMGLPALFIPLPTAADNHQEINARSLADADAAEMLLQKDLTPESLAAAVARLVADPERLASLSRAARNAARPDAAREICDLCARHAADRAKRRRSEK
jgi:UDP-N-acetylglucosamine--N-acetylmuramyl-(pentapeptide) pyrophosphoryl-undecaprenol N-acetylglucosamine transferase